MPIWAPVCYRYLHMNNTFSASGALRFGWDTFKKRPWLLVGTTLIVLVFLWIINVVQNASIDSTVARFVIFLAALAASTLVDMGFTAFFLRAHDDVMHASFDALWHPKPFWQYFVAVICVGILVVLGLILLIVPGLILMTLFAFVKLLVIDRNLDPIKAMKESVRITSGSRLELFFLLIALVILNVLGALALFVGLLLTVPVSALALTHAYRTLSHNGHGHPNTSQLPLAPNTSRV